VTTTTEKPRRDRSAAVKDAIRASARRLFTAQGFDATGIREIAAEADVNPAIVIRHFGSKEQLFIETVDNVTAWKELLAGPIDTLGVEVVRRITRGRRKGLNVFGTIVRASGRPDIRSRLQESTIALVAEPLIERIGTTDARLRAHLFTAQLVGLMSALALYDDEFLLGAPLEDIVEFYGASLQRMLTGDAPS